MNSTVRKEEVEGTQPSVSPAENGIVSADNFPDETQDIEENQEENQEEDHEVDQEEEQDIYTEENDEDQEEQDSEQDSEEEHDEDSEEDDEGDSDGEEQHNVNHGDVEETEVEEEESQRKIEKDLNHLVEVSRAIARPNSEDSVKDFRIQCLMKENEAKDKLLAVESELKKEDFTDAEEYNTAVSNRKKEINQEIELYKNESFIRGRANLNDLEQEFNQQASKETYSYGVEKKIREDFFPKITQQAVEALHNIAPDNIEVIYKAIANNPKIMETVLNPHEGAIRIHNLFTDIYRNVVDKSSVNSKIKKKEAKPKEKKPYPKPKKKGRTTQKSQQTKFVRGAKKGINNISVRQQKDLDEILKKHR